MPDWYAAYCEPRHEPFANMILNQRGFETLFPHFTEWRGLGNKRTRLVKRAYYPNYLFVLTDNERISRISEIPGVMHIVRGTNGLAAKIPDTVMQWVYSKVDPLGEVHIPTASRSKYGNLRGKCVKISEGSPFWGLIGTILDVDGEDVMIILKMLGAERKVRLPVAQVGEIAPRQNGGPATD